MPMSDYSFFADKWNLTTNCYQSGHLSAELAALGREFMGYDLNRRNYDEYIFKVVKEQRASLIPSTSKAVCGELELGYAAAKQTRENNLRMNSNSSPSTPTHTTCNRIGTMAYCNSY